MTVKKEKKMKLQKNEIPVQAQVQEINPKNPREKPKTKFQRESKERTKRESKKEVKVNDCKRKKKQKYKRIKKYLYKSKSKR